MNLERNTGAWELPENHLTEIILQALIFKNVEYLNCIIQNFALFCLGTNEDMLLKIVIFS